MIMLLALIAVLSAHGLYHLYTRYKLRQEEWEAKEQWIYGYEAYLERMKNDK